MLCKSSSITIKGKIIALLIYYRKEVVLLCVTKGQRRKGWASILLSSDKVDFGKTYCDNEPAIKVWKKSGFVMKKKCNGLLGDKYLFVRKGHKISGGD